MLRRVSLMQALKFLIIMDQEDPLEISLLNENYAPTKPRHSI